MARTTLTKTDAPGNAMAAGETVTMTAADTSNQNQFVASGRDLIIAHNTGGSAHTVTVTSAPDSMGRSGHITAESIAAGAIHVYGPVKPKGWIQSDGNIYLEANHAEIEFGVISLPG